MNCLLQWLSICLIDPSGLYVTVSMSSQLAADPNEGRWCADHFCRGVLGELRVGMKIDISPELGIDYGFRHTSFLSESDRGEESAFVSVTWRPFR